MTSWFYRTTERAQRENINGDQDRRDGFLAIFDNLAASTTVLTQDAERERGGFITDGNFVIFPNQGITEHRRSKR